jgi:hypothetical protein
LCPGFRARLAEAFLGLEQYEAAVKENAAALEILERRPSGQRDPPITLQNSVPSSYPGSNYQMGIPFYLLNKKRERRDNAGDLTVPHAGDLKGAVTENEVKCAMARALYRAGAGELACNLVTKVLEVGYILGLRFTKNATVLMVLEVNRHATLIPIFEASE